jgi:protoheme IX farnesyltransferase
MMLRLHRLCRTRLALCNGIAALGGYLLYPAAPQPAAAVAVVGGVTLLAAAGSVFNQIMERDLDRLMSRTRCRPIPCGTMGVAAAALLGIAALLAGFLILFRFGGAVPTLIGAIALCWYLGIYTPLKRRSPLALAVGALCGALSPLIGWSVAGGTLTDFRVVLFAGAIYLWQMPHFWLLQRRHADDYRTAGIPQLRCHPPLITLWMAATLLLTLAMPMITDAPRISFGVLLTIPAAFLFIRSERARFACFNLSPLMLTLAVAIR